MSCYQLVNGAFQEVEDPVQEIGMDYLAAISHAGYIRQITSSTTNVEGAQITLYSLRASEPGKPEYYIDIDGNSHQIAVVVADDFPALISTLKELGPLVTLLGLEQQANIQNEAVYAREQSRFTVP